MEPPEPTQEEIKERCREIQEGWDRHQEIIRRGGDPFERVEVRRARIGGGVGEPAE